MSDLDGATTAPPQGERITTPGQFAATWNQQTPEQRAQWLDISVRNAVTARRCFEAMHEPRLEELEAAHLELRRRLARIAELCSRYAQVDEGEDHPYLLPEDGTRFLVGVRAILDARP